MYYYLQRNSINDDRQTLLQLSNGWNNSCFTCINSGTVPEEFYMLEKGHRGMQECTHHSEMQDKILRHVSTREMLRQAWDRLHPRYKWCIQSDCLNPSTVLHRNFMNKLKNTKKTSRTLEITEYTDTRHQFYSKDYRKDY